ncbi:hypothetical protein C7999DRAFT_17519 [Corynascus novoguineensis]|uniref:RRM domain-containing protein n=1 Tax=Corynascus novoguineensis TaxID=1126955 RepID=A0AAN7CMZ4_9PEZI|nr:hypothetical protein C7999DRAFT_17519 [Corynascus novoguineensis]
MNQIRAIQALNKREIENGVPPEASWHTDYRDTAFIYFGGLPYELSEGDVITIFSQFGEPVFLKLVRDKETGKSKGFGWLKYEDQRSTDLAVDNLGGAEIGGRLIRVDHARYKARDDEDLDEYRVSWEDMLRRERAEKGLPSEEDETDDEDARQRARPMIKEEQELQLLIQNHDDDDPMKKFLIEDKKKEVEEALRKENRRLEKEERKHRDKERHHHRSHRSRRHGSDDEGRDRDRYRDRDDRDTERKGEDGAGIRSTMPTLEKARKTETGKGGENIVLERTVTVKITRKIGMNIDGGLRTTRVTAASVDIAIWRIEDGATGKGVEAAHRAHTGTKGALQGAHFD